MDVRTIVVATGVAPLPDGVSVITDVINAVVGGGADDEAGAAAEVEVEGAAKLDDC